MGQLRQGRPRQSRNLPPRKLTVLRFERWKRGLSLQIVSTLTTIPLVTLSELERGNYAPKAADLEALGKLFRYEDPSVLLLEAMVVPMPAQPVHTNG
jgi:hypothetical protein